MTEGQVLRMREGSGTLHQGHTEVGKGWQRGAFTETCMEVLILHFLRDIDKRPGEEGMGPGRSGAPFSSSFMTCS